MAIFEEKMYGLQCDNCDEICSDGNGINIWPDRNQAIANAQEWNEWIEHEGKYYCPKCYEIDDNDCVIIKAKKKMNAQDLVGRRVERTLQRVLPNSVTIYTQEGEVHRTVRGSNGRKVWVLFDGNSTETSVEVSKLKVID